MIMEPLVLASLGSFFALVGLILAIWGGQLAPKDRLHDHGAARGGFPGQLFRPPGAHLSHLEGSVGSKGTPP